MIIIMIIIIIIIFIIIMTIIMILTITMIMIAIVMTMMIMITRRRRRRRTHLISFFCFLAYRFISAIKNSGTDNVGSGVSTNYLSNFRLQKIIEQSETLQLQEEMSNVRTVSLKNPIFIYFVMKSPSLMKMFTSFNLLF